MDVSSAPQIAAEAPESARHLLLLSGDSEAALAAAGQRLCQDLAANPHLDLAGLAADLARVPAAEQRAMLICGSAAEAHEILTSGDPKRLLTGRVDRPRSVAFLFSGQGAQYPGMGQALYRTYSTFQAEVDACAELLLPVLGLDLRRLLFPDHPGDPALAEELNQTCNTQPALFVIEVAMARQWQAWGVKPEVMIGHSIGEYAAATLAGVMTREAALGLVAARGRLMQSLPPGAMLSVPMAEAELLPLLGDQLSIAATNGPQRLVVSGPEEAVEALKAQLAEKRKPCQRLHTSHAFHSVMMEPILQPFIAEVRKVALHPPQIPYVANTTGNWITAAEATDPAYYARHLRQAVRFSEGVSTLLADPQRILLEVGPGKTLISLAQRHPDRSPNHLLLGSMRHPKDQDVDDRLLVLQALGQLWLAGVAMDWPAFAGRFFGT